MFGRYIAAVLCLVSAASSQLVSLSSDTTQFPFALPTSVSDNISDPELLNISTFYLSEIHDNAYTILHHPLYQSHRIRIKKTGFCDPTVNVYTGYLDVDYGAKHLFFYFFESRRNPAKDDVMMWINGGPGCSSAMGMLMELGPCSIDMKSSSSNGTNWNPHSWNSEANLFFLDQPVGVGYSYADYGQVVDTTEEAAKNIHAFLTIFFEAFPQFTGRALHLAGESYGGRYLPVFASEIIDQNAIAQADGRPTLNLNSVLIGNGVTDISTLYPGRFDIECGTAALDVPFQSISACVRMKQALPRCQKKLKNSCIDLFDAIDCQASVNFCEAELGSHLRAAGRNPYDVSRMCGENPLCYDEMGVIVEYLNDPVTRTFLGATTPNNFTSCSDTVGTLFAAQLDKWRIPTHYYVAGLLDREVRMLIYAGTYDWQCNWVSNREWVEKLEWSGHDAYVREDWRDWYAQVDGKERKVGETKSAGRLTFATIREAGHMMSHVPHDKPAESLTMVSKWLAGKPL